MIIFPTIIFKILNLTLTILYVKIFAVFILFQYIGVKLKIWGLIIGLFYIQLHYNIQLCQMKQQKKYMILLKYSIVYDPEMGNKFSEYLDKSEHHLILVNHLLNG